MRLRPTAIAPSLVLLAIASLAATSRPQPSASPSASPTLQLLQPSKRSPTAAPASGRPQDDTSASPAATTTGTSHAWVASILGGADRVDSDDRSTAAPNSQAEEDQPNATSAAAFSSTWSLAPTDSGEDPLETTTDLNLDDDDERRLVESNNVSLARTVAAAAKPHRAADTTQSPPPPPRQSLSCDQANNQCELREACAPALKAYNDDCRELVNNRTSQCAPKCLRALIALRSSEEGDDLVQCECQGNQYCEASKLRVQACRPQVELAVDPQTRVACSTASWICMADQPCLTAFKFYYRNCQTLFSQRHCSLQCNNSLAVLYRLPKAKKLIDCQCDGSEDFPCVKYKTLTERLCFGQTPNLNNDIHGPDAEEAGGLGEEEGQLDFPVSFTNERLSSEEVDGLNFDSNDHDNDQDSASQLPEDNWIPRSRYFTNLHQQQQQQVTRKGAHQQQHMVGKQKSKSATATANNRPREPTTMTTTTGRRRRLLAMGSSASSSSSANWLPLMGFVSTWWVPCIAFASVVFVSTILCKLPTR